MESTLRPLLALELSCPSSTVALGLPGGEVLERGFGGERGRALLAEVEALMAAAGLAPADLRAVVAGTGPGSYTGLRIACAAARPLCLALGVEARRLCRLSPPAPCSPAGRPAPLLRAPDLPVVYHACYRRDADDVSVRQALRVLPRDAAPAAVPAGALVLGDPALLGDAAAACRFLGESVSPSARQLLQLAEARGAAAWSPAEPLYLRAAR
ncbi:MAG: tRNA (adenosine(37)-N6)-threonylcarbamoyltransferase complex dimerization subunit type 1 TsaB [Planctomycetes bacterium]|nr:tRNA (adenosine(37)-N6)-threonylcarbamoyltransferase complex dimerization subunit type 1 TsaB [Planctomycetota bacterium]